MFIFVNKRESKKKIVVFFHGYPVTAQNIKYMDYKTMFIRKSKGNQSSRAYSDLINDLCPLIK